MAQVEPVTTRMPEALASLRRNRVFGAAGDAELTGMLARSTLVGLAEREVLFRQGDAGRAAVAVMTGFIKISAVSPGGREVILEICGPGSMFGELAVLNGWPRSADATALSLAEVISIPGEVLRATLGRSPDVALALIGVVSRRLRLATEQITDAITLPGPARLAKALGQLVAAHGRPMGRGLQVDVALTQRELGGMTGLARETINKQLTAWRDLGWLELSPRHILLLEVEALRMVVEEAAI